MNLLRLPRLWFALGLVFPLGLTAFGVVLTAHYGVAACPLCIVQRMFYLLIAALSLIGLMAVRSALGRRMAAIIMAASAAVGTAIAGYQIYLQKHPFTATCGDGTAWWERIVDQAGQTLPLLFKADGLCSDNTWFLLGLSIVEWSLLAFVGLFVVAMLALFSRFER